MYPSEAFPKAWAWIAPSIGVISLLVAFWADHLVVAIITLIALVGIVWLIWWLDRPEFTFISVEKTLTIHDAEGRSATLVRDQTAKANHKGITEFWCRNISADGQIENIRVDNEPPFQIKREAGDTQVCKRFERPLKRGDNFTTVLAYDLIDCFLAKSEGLIHVVGAKTKKLRLTTVFPDEKRPTAVRASMRFGGEVHKELKPVEMGNRLQLEVRRPKLGAEYCLEWDW